MLTIISGALAPSIALLSYIYLKDRYESEPLKLIIKMFIMGVLLVFPAYVFEHMLQQGMGSSFLTNIVSISVIEEFLKWFVIYFMIYKHVEFNEPYDGVVYSVSVAIGFATIENIGYLIFNQYSPAYALLRSLLPVTSHAIFGIIMGYYLGLAKFYINKEKFYLVQSFLLPVVFHILYNLILYQTFINWYYIMIPFLGALWWIGLKKIKIASSLSPFK